MKGMIDSSCGISFKGMPCLLWLLFPFIEFFVKVKNNSKNFAYKFVVIISFALLQSSYFNFSRSFQIILFLTNFTQLPSLNRYEKVTCENCGTQTTKPNLARHKNKCSVGTLYCTQCPNFSKKSESDLNYHFAKKHSSPKPDITFKCKLCYQEFPGFMFYFNTKKLNMDRKWDSERETLTWRI